MIDDRWSGFTTADLRALRQALSLHIGESLCEDEAHSTSLMKEIDAAITVRPEEPTKGELVVHVFTFRTQEEAEAFANGYALTEGSDGLSVPEWNEDRSVWIVRIDGGWFGYEGSKLSNGELWH